MPAIRLDEWMDLGVIGCRPIIVTERRMLPNLENCAVVNITDSTLPGADWNTAYSHALTVAGGTAPYTWTLFDGTIPDGVGFSSSGVLSGTPTNFGDFPLMVRVEDAGGNVCIKEVSLNVDLGADLWVKADDTDSTGVLSNGQNIDTWFDISGNNRHLQNAVLSSDTPPVYRTNLLDGKPGADFGVLGGLNYVGWTRVAGEPFTVFIVLQSYSNVNVGRRALNAGDAVSNWLMGPYTGSWRFYNGGFVTGPAIDLNPHLAYITQDAAALGTFVFDGVTIGSNAGTQVPGLVGIGNLYVGEDALCYVYEMIWFGRILTAPEIGYVTNYLKAEWPSLP